MKNILKLILFIICFGTLLHAKKYALVIGVPSGFEEPFAQGIRLDIAGMKILLEEYGYDVQTLSDPRPKHLRKALHSYEKLTPNDHFVFYYSGHGGQVPDKNGDEVDGKDEVLCLKEKIKGELQQGDWSSLFLDDELYVLLSKIKSKKFVVFDSCNSGTAFKNNSDDNFVIRSKGFFKDYEATGIATNPISSSKTEASASLMFFGAAKDGTSSLGNERGGLFTLSILDALKRNKGDLNKDGKITFKELRDYTRKRIENLLINQPEKIYTPQMHTASFSLNSDVVKTLSAANNTSQSELEQQLDNLLNEGMATSLQVTAQSKYKDGEPVTLKINTKDKMGYLYVIYVDAKDYTVLYPNKYASDSKEVNGHITFPNKSFGNFRLSAGKPYGRTVVFTILSSKPLDLYDKGLSGVFNVIGRNSSKSMRLLNTFKDLEMKSTGTSIGKTIFDVRP